MRNKVAMKRRTMKIKNTRCTTYVIKVLLD